MAKATACGPGAVTDALAPEAPGPIAGAAEAEASHWEAGGGRAISQARGRES